MKRMISIEIKRSMFNMFFLISIIIGAMIAISQVLMVVMPGLQQQMRNFGYWKNVYPNSVYNTWIGGEGYTLHPEVLNLLLPFLAVLPYGCSLYEDKNSGYYNQICIRVPKRYYIYAKTIAVFISGGSASVFPFVLNLFLSYMIMPAVKPSVSSMRFPVFGDAMFCEFYYTHPFVYAMFFCVMIFVVGGLIAEIPFCTYWMFSNVFAIFSLPFIYWILEAYLLDMLGLSNLAFRYYVRPDQPIQHLSFAIWLIKILLGGIILLICHTIGNKNGEIV